MFPYSSNVFRDQLRSKEMHIEMMRKKMNRLEIESGQRSSLAVDRDDAVVALQVGHFGKNLRQPIL